MICSGVWRRRFVESSCPSGRWDSHTRWINLRVSGHSNCLVKGNPPIPYQRTVQDSPEETWDRDYRARAWRCPVFLVTEPLFRELRESPVVTGEMMEEAFGRIPGLLTPPAYPEARVRRLLELAGVAIAA